MEDKEKRILESARKFFFRYGFKKTSLDEVAEDAGIAKGTIYNYFKNKEDLFVCNIKSNHQEVWQDLEQEMCLHERADEKLLHSTLLMIRHHRKMVKEFAMSKAVLEELLFVGMNLIHDIPEHNVRIMEFLQEGEKHYKHNKSLSPMYVGLTE